MVTMPDGSVGYVPGDARQPSPWLLRPDADPLERSVTALPDARASSVPPTSMRAGG